MPPKYRCGTRRPHRPYSCCCHPWEWKRCRDSGSECRPQPGQTSHGYGRKGICCLREERAGPEDSYDGHGSDSPTPVCSCLQCPKLSEVVHFLLWELSKAFYIFHRHRVCLVDHVYLICNLYSWWKGFGFSSLVTLPLGFNCGFISTSAWSSPGVCS